MLENNPNPLPAGTLFDQIMIWGPLFNASLKEETEELDKKINKLASKIQNPPIA